MTTEGKLVGVLVYFLLLWKRINFISQLTVHHEGTSGQRLEGGIQGRNWSRNYGGLLTNLLPVACSAAFLSSQDCSQLGPSPVDHQSKKQPTDPATGQPKGGHSLTEVSSSQVCQTNNQEAIAEDQGTLWNRGVLNILCLAHSDSFIDIHFPQK